MSNLGSMTLLSPTYMIREYMTTSLTYPTDILRAVTGILTALYGHSTSFGMSWKDIGKFIL
jgi:hypothetical protein